MQSADIGELIARQRPGWSLEQAFHTSADRNPNAFVDLSRATEKDFVVADQTIYHDAEHPSHVELPIIPQSRERHWIETPFPRVADVPAQH